MTEKRYSDGTLAKWYYSRNNVNVISDGTNEYYLGSKESIRDWNYDDLFGTNDLLDELNRLSDENKQLKQQLQKIQDSFEVSWTQNYIEFDKDKLYIKDNNTEIRLNDRNLFIEVYIPQTNEYYRFRYIVTGRGSKMREFIKNYNSKGDDLND